MSEFQKLLLLAYVEDAKTNFSYFEFAKRIGASVSVVEKMIDDAIKQKRVRCDDSNIYFVLTSKGKGILNDTGVLYYSLKEEREVKLEPEHIPISKPYVPEDFLKKLN